MTQTINPQDNEFIISSFLESRRAESTKEMYEFELRKFLRFIENKPLVEIGKWDISNYSKEVKKSTKKAATLKRIYTTLRGLFGWMVKMNLIEDDPTDGPLPKITVKTNANNKILTKDEVDALLKTAYPDAKEYALIMLLATTGLRINEVCQSDWKDISQDSKGNTQIHVIRKGGNDEYIPLLPITVAALERYKKVAYSARPEDPIFGRLFRQTYGRMTINGLRKIVSIIAGKAGIDKAVSPHWFRHSFASHTVNNGAGLVNVKEAMGHGHVTTTELYYDKKNVM